MGFEVRRGGNRVYQLRDVELATRGVQFASTQQVVA
jgi:hypothetical protein